jgi:hypothetical protein
VRGWKFICLRRYELSILILENKLILLRIEEEELNPGLIF